MEYIVDFFRIDKFRSDLMNKLIELIKSKPILSSLLLIISANAITNFPLQNYLSNFMSYQAALMISIFVLQMSCFGILMYLSHKIGISNAFNMNLSKPIKSLWLIIPFLILVIINVYCTMKLEY